MKNARLKLFLFFITLSSFSYAQKKVSELSLVYEASITTGSKEPKLADAFDGATTTVYIKGSMSRSEMVSALASFTTIHDATTGSSVILQEVSGQKLLIRMTAENWKDKNKRYEGITFSNTTETKTIAGYKCVKSIAKMRDGPQRQTASTEIEAAKDMLSKGKTGDCEDHLLKATLQTK